jgi:hypothetical protein
MNNWFLSINIAGNQNNYNINKIVPKNNHISRTLTSSTSEVLIYHGATELVLMLSFAHSHAKFLANWFMAPKKHRWQEPTMVDPSCYHLHLTAHINNSILRKKLK